MYIMCIMYIMYIMCIMYIMHIMYIMYVMHITWPQNKWRNKRSNASAWVCSWSEITAECRCKRSRPSLGATHALPSCCMNTVRRAEETWTDQGKNGQPTSMKKEKPGRADTLVFLMTMTMMNSALLIITHPPRMLLSHFLFHFSGWMYLNLSENSLVAAATDVQDLSLGLPYDTFRALILQTVVLTNRRTQWDINRT